MLRSLFAGVSGMRNHQVRMDVIGNNIANVNTTGFKSGRVNFSDQLSQLVTASSAPTSSRGGTNPRQVGLGVQVASIDTIMTQGNLQNTSKITDLALQGDGYFVLSDGQNRTYTRAGTFDFDRQGNLVNPGSGMKVMGWMADNAGVINTAGPLQGLNIPLGSGMAPQATSTTAFRGNLDARVAVGATFDSSSEVYDSQGNKNIVTYRFTKTAANTWDWAAQSVTGTAGTTVAAPGPHGTLTFDANGLLLTASAPGTYQLAHTNGATTPQTITPNFGTVGAATGITQFSDAATAVVVDQNGYTNGDMTGVAIDGNGVISGMFSNGRAKTLGQIAVSTFATPTALTKVGDSMYVTSNNSGEAVIRSAGTAEAGSITSGALEMSNVDLAQQFSDMIVTQRGFQANSKTITTSDEILQELMNLKR